MDEFIQRQIVRCRPTRLAAVGLGVMFAILGAGVRLSLDPIVHGAVPYIAFFPMLLAAALVSGAVGGGACLVGSTAIALAFLIPPFELATPAPSAAVFLAFGAMLVYVGAALRRSLIQLLEATRQERIFTLELQHRVKNTLAVVQSVASQTARTSQNPSDFKYDLGERLIAIAEAHNVLCDAGWRPVPLKTVAERVLNPVRRTGRISLAGPDVSLAADQAVNLSLALQELAANARKHGALSNGQGQISLTWLCEGDRRVAVRWLEKGGPRVDSPTHQGFGMRLLRRGIGGNEPWEPTLDFSPEGLRCGLVFELAAAQAAPPSLRRRAVITSIEVDD
jgi:two-component sensor histidine kinase